MVSRFALVLFTAILVVLASAPAQARGPDTVIARDTMIDSIWALNGDLVYQRRGSTTPERAWMARYHGHLRRARGIPRAAGGVGMGRDAKGRKVFIFATNESGSPGSTKWFLYYLARNRSGRLGTPATSCPIDWLSMWRDSTAYTTSCKDPAKNELVLKRGRHTQRFPRDGGGFRPVFRPGEVASLWEDGNDNVGIAQYVAGGKTCVKLVDAAIGDATDSEGWFPSDLWATNGYLTWTMGNPRLRSDFAILAARAPSRCRMPGPVGRFPFKATTARVQALAVDSRHVFYADDETLHSQTLPATPSFAPPSNDNFAHARQMSGDAPLSAGGNTGHATVESGEPLGRSGHSVWYAYRPKTSGTVYVTVTPSCPYNPPGDFCGGTYRTGVYTGSRPDDLTLLHRSGGPYTPVYTRVDGVAGKTYWISVGSSFDPNYTPFTVHVDGHPPP
jgi:hypothetical protein